MAQWWVWWGDKVLHKPLTDEWNVEDGRLSLAVSTAGSFDATITPLHPLYTELIEAPVKGGTLVRVERDGDELWRGFLESREVRPLDGALDVRFVGELGYLANTVMPPYSQKGSPRHIVTYWLNAHNAQAAPAQKIYTGRVDIADKGGNDYIVRACDKPTNMWTEISSKTIESSDGGFLVLRRVNGKLYLDWVNDPSVSGGQPVKLGFNLTDMSDLVDGSELLTAVYPLGATVSETVDETVVEDGKTVTRKKTVSRTVNLDEYPDFTRGGISKRGHLIVNDELADIHGIVAEVVSWPDVELPSNLLDRAMDYVASLGEPRSITLSATDMSNAGYDVEAFSLAQRIKLDTPTVKGEMLVTGITYDILDPTSDTITFGDVASTASGQQVQTGILVNNAAMQAETAKTQADNAYYSAQTAVEVADGKSTTFFQPTQPENPSDGDVWFDSSDENHSYRYENEGWADVQDEGIPAAQATADAALAIAEDTSSWFWHDSNGVHVSTQDGVSEGSQNLLITSVGIFFRRLHRYIVTISQNAMSFWDGLGNGGSHVLASFGSDGARIGQANSINNTVGNDGFSVKAGKDEVFSVDVDPVPLETAYGFPKRAVYKVYRAGYLSEGGSIGPAIEEGYLHISSSVDDPDLKLYFGDTWASNGAVSGATGMLMSVDELIEHYEYSAYDSELPVEMGPYYDRIVTFDDDQSTTPRSTSIKYVDNDIIDFRCGFSQEILDQIPVEAWDDSAVEAGTCNWFIGSVYDLGTASLRLNGEPWSGTAPADYTGCTDDDPGVHGLVPAAAAGGQDGLLGGDAEWHPPLENLDIEALLTNAG